MENIKNLGVQMQGNNQASTSSGGSGRGGGDNFQLSLQQSLQSLLASRNSAEDPFSSGSAAAAALSMTLLERRRHKAGAVDTEFKFLELPLEDHRVNEDDLMFGELPLSPLLGDPSAEGTVIPPGKIKETWVTRRAPGEMRRKLSRMIREKKREAALKRFVVDEMNLAGLLKRLQKDLPAEKEEEKEADHDNDE